MKRTPNLLITPTLLNSFEFALNAPPSWKDRAFSGLVAQIRREKKEYPAYCQQGIKFEDTVYRECSKASAQGQKEVTSGTDKFQQVANLCLGGNFQKVYKKELYIPTHPPFMVYCKLDVDFPEGIIDLKTTIKWKGDKKYLKGSQHTLYLWASGKTEFEYVVVEWFSETVYQIKNIYRVPYTMKDSEVVEVQLKEKISTLIDFLHSEKLYDDYYFTFSKNK